MYGLVETRSNHKPKGRSKFLELIDLCREAGATASTVIQACDKAVLFYKDPESPYHNERSDFDELHIQAGEKALILVAVFLEKKE